MGASIIMDRRGKPGNFTLPAGEWIIRCNWGSAFGFDVSQANAFILVFVRGTTRYIDIGLRMPNDIVAPEYLYTRKRSRLERRYDAKRGSFGEIYGPLTGAFESYWKRVKGA